MLQRQCLIFRSLALVLLYIIFCVSGAQAQGRYVTELAKAEQAYNEGFFDQVIALVTTCLTKGGLTTVEQAWAYKLLGQAYISKNELQPARLYVQKLLEVAPDYAPDRDQDLQMWIVLVEEAKQERERQIQQQQLSKPDDEPVVGAASIKKGGGKKWLWIGGGGAVVASTAAFLIFRGDDTKQRLPDPPGPPPRP